MIEGMVSTNQMQRSSTTSIERLRIALFTYSTKPRGSVIHTLELAEALHQLGHSVCVYTLDKEGQGFDFPLSCSYCLIPAQQAPSEIDALIQQRIAEFVNYLSQHQIRYDIYHAQDCLSANALVLLRQQQPIPALIRTVHHIEDYRSPYLQQCQERSIREVDQCFCVSDRWQKELQQHYQIHAPRVSNGVNLKHFSPNLDGSEASLKQRLGLTGSPIYLTVGGIEPRKNSLNLLRAFALLREESPTAQLVIAGGATLFDYQAYREEFFALAEELGITIGQSLILPGVIPDRELPVLYRLADAFVFPSLKEGWGLVVLEAIACGLPIITPNQPPFTEFLNSHNALLVDPESPTAIANAMYNIQQPDTAQSLIQQSRLIPVNYTWDASARTHVQHYRQLLQQHQPSQSKRLLFTGHC
jgi:glycosyltransferase-like protein